MRTKALYRLAILMILCLLPGEMSAVDRITFTKRFGQVEAGGPFAGAEFHGSRPLPSRISFYYPVANSIDLSTGYWERGLSAPMALTVQVDSAAPIPLGTGGWDYTLSPNTVTFFTDTAGMRCSIRYDFCFTMPAMAVTYTIRNASTGAHRFTAVTRDSLTLRTCQTYARKEKALMSRAPEFDAVVARFNEADTDSSSVFVMNAGQPSAAAGTNAQGAAPDSAAQQAAFGRPYCMMRYEKNVAPGDSLVIVQLFGSCRNDEVASVMKRVRSGWKEDVQAYARHVRATVAAYAVATGDTVLDRSAGWAAAMLASNRHYIDGSIEPMPCPAEYNFFFTHDVLLTDLGAVHFDRARVKSDLNYIVSLARDTVIPHAYYWRDDGMKTEYCPPDNWNHLWFILASAAYVRHTHDDSMAAALYPFVRKSLDMLLTQMKSDGLLYAKHPDWWDIGNVEGPRAYITALAVRAIGEYSFLACTLEKDVKRLAGLEKTAERMKAALIKTLWDPQARYLINYNGKDRDDHIYAGSLVAGAYGVLDRERSLQMAETARRTIVDSVLGVRTVSPADFHLPSVIAYFHLAGNEAGDPYFYANGGVWPHTTAWYIWLLNAVGQRDEAASVLKRTLSVDGIMASPMGLPAMFEYRYADRSSPRYGEIDKPTFMWAAGFFLQSLYRVYGVTENEWNISFGARPDEARGASRYPFEFSGVGNDKTTASKAEAQGSGRTSAAGTVVRASSGTRRARTIVHASGRGGTIARMRVGGSDVPSAVLPLDAGEPDTIRITYGAPEGPLLEGINAVVHHAETVKGGIAITVSSFAGHVTKASFICPRRPKRIVAGGRSVTMTEHRMPEHGTVIEISFTAGAGMQTIQLFQ